MQSSPLAGWLSPRSQNRICRRRQRRASRGTPFRLNLERLEMRDVPSHGVHEAPPPDAPVEIVPEAKATDDPAVEDVTADAPVEMNEFADVIALGQGSADNSISGFVFLDRNNDSVRDAGEDGIVGVTIQMTGTLAAGGDIGTLTVTTEADGSFTFDQLAAGTYTLVETQPDGFEDGSDSLGTPFLGTLADDEMTVTISDSASAMAGTEFNFGELNRSTISGKVFNDKNANATFDAGDVGIAGVTMYLIGSDVFGAPVLRFTTTDAGGNYSFSDLVAGTYRLLENQPNNFLNSGLTVGTGGGIVVGDTISDIVLSYGATVTGYFFGEQECPPPPPPPVCPPPPPPPPPATHSISGYVFQDCDNDGVRDGNEAGIAGAGVTLTGVVEGDIAVVFSTTTDANGFYFFDNLKAGKYTLVETQPGAFLDGKDSAGTPFGGVAVPTIGIDRIEDIVIPTSTVALAGTEYNFGEVNGSLSGFVYEDLDDDGVKDAGENGIAGVSLTLTGTNDIGEAVTVSTTTAADGSYSFLRLRPGTYQISESQPAGYQDGKDTVGDAGGAVIANDVIGQVVVDGCTAGKGYNFGERKPPPPVFQSISGYVFCDEDNDGVRDAGEEGIAGVLIHLSGTLANGDDAGVVAATTDATGKYVFAGLLPGTYEIHEVQPAGYDDGKDSLGTPFSGTVANDTLTVVVTESATAREGVEYNFGELGASSISGRVYFDANKNGILDAGDSGLAGVTLTLTGTDFLGAAVAATVTTSASGDYTFADLKAGTYQIIESQPNDLINSVNVAGSAGGTVQGDVIASIVLPACTNATGYFFGEKECDCPPPPPPPPPEKHSISGYVFQDCDNDGVRDPGEVGIAGVEVTLTGVVEGDIAVFFSTTTDANGFYAFDDLKAGKYRLVETQPAAFLDGSDSAGTQFGGTADARIGFDDISNIVIPDSTVSLTGTEYNFGEVNGSLAGFVYNDLDDDGVKDTGEPGIAGVTITLTGTNDIGQNVSVTATTGADGSYGFFRLRPGTYQIAETQPGGFIDGQDSVGDAGGSNAANDVISQIVVGGCTTGNGYNFGERTPAKNSISGYVYVDCDNDGVRDAGEEGIAGVEILLSGAAPAGGGVFAAKTTTDATGRYEFSDLPANHTYTIQESQPAAYLDGKDSAGTPFGGTADARIGFDVITGIIIPSSATAQAGVEYNFGEVNSSLAGFVYNDLDDDGVKDAGEPGIAGVTITLAGTNDIGQNVSVTATTGADGSYGFFRLRPGTYQIAETQPGGFIDGKDTVGDAGGSNAANDVISQIVVDGCTTGNGYNFGERTPAKNSISGFVFEDCDNDGVRDAGEEGIAGVEILLLGAAPGGGGVFALTTTTDASGRYEFTDLPGGYEYNIQEVQPLAFLDGKDSAGTPFGGTADARIGFDVITGIIIPSSATAQAGVEYNFGEVNGSLAGFIYNDLDDDGVKDAGEPGIAGVTITLTGTNDIGQNVSVTATTGADGSYGFFRLRPGTYQIAETQPGGFIDGKDTVGDAGGSNAANDVISQIVVNGCTTGNGYNFGERTPAKHSISGFVFEDCDNDGVFDAATETGIAGVTVVLSGTDVDGVAVLLQATTGADGSYVFFGLNAGQYTLNETQPVNFLDGKDAAGTPFGGSADARVGFDVISNIVIANSPTALAGVDYNFGEVNGSVRGAVYNDKDDDGVRDVDEAGIQGVTVTLTGVNDEGETITLTATTGADGNYVFSNLRPGTYKIAETQPDGYIDGKETVGDAGGSVLDNDVIGGILITGCTHANGYNFGEQKPAKQSISGFVYEDCDNDGVRDPGEAGIAGVEIELVGRAAVGVLAAKTFTDVNGFYQFDNLPGGFTYEIREVTQPAAFLDGSDSAGTPFGGTADARIGFDEISGIFIPDSTAATTGVEYNFGEVNGSLSGFVYIDADDDGLKDAGENGIAGVTITLAGTNDLGDNVSFTVTTEADGSYSFERLRPGTYTLTETQPNGYIDGGETVGSAGGSLGGNDIIRQIVVDGCTAGDGYNFGERTPAKHSISGYVYEDCDNDGVRDPGEAGIAGVAVTIEGAFPGGGVFAFGTTTDASGKYEFTDLPSGPVYTIRETQPGGFLDGTDSAGTPFGGSADARIGFDVISDITIPFSATALAGVEYNFGEVNGSLSGFVYEDVDGDGARDGGEPGIAGVTVTLTGTNDLGDDVSIQLTTSADGSYTFDSLRPGTYTLTETQPNGYIDGAETVGSAGGSLGGNDIIRQIVVDGCTAGDGYNFGERKPALQTLSGFVYCDDDNDGRRDAGEDGIGGVRVVLTGAGVTLTATTNSSGKYEFANLKAGTYTLREIQPADYADGKDSAGTPFGGSADTRVDFDVISDIVIPESTTSRTGVEYNFGELNSILSGYVYEDDDNDGVFDANESGIAGVTIVLVGTNDLNQSVNVTTTTNADGYYEFSKLRPGTYHIGERQPDGYLDGKDTLGDAGGQIAGNDTFACTIVGGCVVGKNYNFGERLGTTGREGLTPGYWKANAVQWNAVSWGPTGFSPNQSLVSVFAAAGEGSFAATLGNLTLLQALQLGGGGVNALMRHAVAAILNAAHPNVAYPITSFEIVASVNSALRSGDADDIEDLHVQLDVYNNFGASLDQHGNAA